MDMNVDIDMDTDMDVDRDIDILEAKAAPICIPLGSQFRHRRRQDIDMDIGIDIGMDIYIDIDIDLDICMDVYIINSTDGQHDYIIHNKIVTIDHIVDGFDKTPSSLRDMLTGNCTGKVLVRYSEQ